MSALLFFNDASVYIHLCLKVLNFEPKNSLLQIKSSTWGHITLMRLLGTPLRVFYPLIIFRNFGNQVLSPQLSYLIFFLILFFFLFFKKGQLKK